MLTLPLVRLFSLLFAFAAAAHAQNFAIPEELGMSFRRLAAYAPLAVSKFRAAVLAETTTQPVAPINSGFAALGPADKRGKVTGTPFGMGNGTYRVAQNDSYQVIFALGTPFVDGTFTLKRDSKTGEDSLGFAGKTRDNPLNGWTELSGIYPGQITYDAASDAGTISWQMNGERKRDAFRNGRAGRRGMIITLGGYAHTFTQD